MSEHRKGWVVGLWGAALLAFTGCTTAPPEPTPPRTWDSVDRKLRYAPESEATIMAGFDLAMDAVCKSYMMGGVTLEAVMSQPGLAPLIINEANHPPGTMGAGPGTRAIQVLASPQVEGGRACWIMVRNSGPMLSMPTAEQLRERLVAWIARQPGGLTLSGGLPPQAQFARRELWCSPAAGFSVLVSTQAVGSQQDLLIHVLFRQSAATGATTGQRC